MSVFPIEELLKQTPRPRIHFIGIGGVHMSAMAKLLFTKGLPITGNDREESDNVLHLRSIGIPVEVGHEGRFVEGADIIVRNAAIHDASPDMVRARELGLPIYERPEVLGALMKDAEDRFCIAGTHGKSTTTAMCSRIAELSGLDPTVFCGAKIPETGVAYRFGAQKAFIAESCEYFDSFLSFYPTYAVILNVEPDHLDYFSDIHQIRSSFKRFASLVPEDRGVVIANGDDLEIRKFLSDIDRKVIYFGFEEDNDYRAVNCESRQGGFSFDVEKDGSFLTSLELAIPGRHHGMDALAALAMTHTYGLELSVIVEALESFHGAKRRFEKIGCFHGADVVDDFAHHPTELMANLVSAKTLGYNRIICVYQPHTYSRTEALYQEFAKALSEADMPILVPIYPAREENIHHISSALIADHMEKPCKVLGSMGEAEELLKKIARPGDLIMTTGAGDIFKLGYRLIKSV